MLELKFPNWVSMFNDTDQGTQQDEWRTEDKITKIVVSNCDILKMSRNASCFCDRGQQTHLRRCGDLYEFEMLNFFSDQKGFYLFGNFANVAPTLFILIRPPWTM
jgi:hypothetical protein